MINPQLMTIILILPLLLNLVLLASLMAYAVRQRSPKVARHFAGVCLCLVVWNAGFVVEILVPSLGGKLLFSNISLTAINLLSPAWFALVAMHSGLYARLKQFLWLTLALPCTTILIIWTNDLNRLFRTVSTLSNYGGYLYLDSLYGPWYYWIYLPTTYFLLGLSLLALIFSFFRQQAIYRNQTGATWDTHPNNLGHMQTAGCFRCHDGKHLDANQQAIRLECNLCHSIPVQAGQQDFVTKIEISRGPEPESHRNANWISLHNKAFDATCANCHTTEGAGSTTNTSFCSNSACHGSTYTYAGFDAPKLREILQAQLPTPTPAPKPPANLSNPTYDNGIEALFNAKCAVCHQGASAPKGIDVTTYAGVMKGGAGGAIIVPNDSANSILVQVQGGQHFATFSPEELALIKQWIDAGAPEK